MKAKTYAFMAWLLLVVLLGVTWTVNNNTTTISVSAGSATTSGGVADIIAVENDVVLYNSYRDGDGDGVYEYDVTAEKVGKVVDAGTNVDFGTTTKTVNNLLYKIKTADTGRYMVIIFITNVDELIHAYGYLNLNITIYNSDSSWTKNTKEDSGWITLMSGHVTLFVEGNNYYVIGVPDGVFYCINASDSNNLVPRFYIMVEQA